MWTLEQALTVIRTIQPDIKKFNYHAALAGSVLNNGKSVNDLDIILLPIYNDKPIQENLLRDYLNQHFVNFSNDENDYPDNDTYFKLCKSGLPDEDLIDWFIIK